MTSRPADTLLLTRDESVVDLTTSLLPEGRTEIRQSFSAALLGITSDTRLLIIDSAAGVPMAHLLAALFLDQQPGRTAIVILPRGVGHPPDVDPRVQMLGRPLSSASLRTALLAGARTAAAFRDLSGLARLAAAVR
jgi:hypothetical protein